MDESMNSAVSAICREHGSRRARLLDIARAVQERYACVSSPAVDTIARELVIPRVEVDALVSFYSFLSHQPRGRIPIRLCDDVIDRMFGYERVAGAFEEALGISLGETTADGEFSLQRTACIGMCDQAPGALIGDVVVTELSTDRAREIVRELREHGDPRRLVHKVGDGNNADPLVHAMVKNNIQLAGGVIFSPIKRRAAIGKALWMSPMEVIRAVKAARLRGRGGAGFPTGMKWEFARAAEGERKYVICNADEGEPGTFKDRVLLTERPNRVFAGMTIAGYAIGSDEGILYLRAEYAYLRRFLEAELERRRANGLLGSNLLGRSGFDFDIRIQMGAGAYVCGEETALISSGEGYRGDPKNRPPFPAQKGYRGYPTVVNNVETLCCVAKILHEGPATFCSFGTQQSSGTKLLSISGDCSKPGIYELPFGRSLREILDLAGGAQAAAVLVGGPSGRLVGPDEYGRKLCFDDLATGGAIVVFNEHRDLLRIVRDYGEFFEDESCGYCTPCRVGSTLLRRGMDRILEGRAEPGDLDQMLEVATVMKKTSRCGLGQTAPNPFTSSLAAFRPRYDRLISDDGDGCRRGFDLERAVAEAGRIRGRDADDVVGGHA